MGQVTEEYLDTEYLEIYCMKYPYLRYGSEGLDIEPITTRMQAFSNDLCDYLASRDIEIVTKDIEPRSTTSCLFLFTRKWEGFGVKISALSYMGSHFMTQPLYEVMGSGGSEYPVRCTAALVKSIHKVLGVDRCSTCHYSNQEVDFCGLGMQMYTTDCSGRRLITT